MKITTVTATEAVNPFAEDIAELDRVTKENPAAGGEFEFPVADVEKSKYKISKAANAIDRTASYKNEVLSKDGKTVTLTVTLKNRHKSLSGAERIARREAIAAAKAAESAAKK